MPNRHCHNCGWEYSIAGLPGRTESCHQCGVDVKVCLNCTHYDTRVAHQCREKRADPVIEPVADLGDDERFTGAGRAVWEPEDVESAKLGSED